MSAAQKVSQLEAELRMLESKPGSARPEELDRLLVELQFQRRLADRESLQRYAPEDPYVRPRADSSPVCHVSYRIDVSVLLPIITGAENKRQASGLYETSECSWGMQNGGLAKIPVATIIGVTKSVAQGHFRATCLSTLDNS